MPHRGLATAAGLCALALSAPACGLSVTLGALGVVLLDEDDDPTVNAAPTGFVDTPAGLVNDIVRLTYRVADPEGDRVDVRVTFSTDGGATWSATPATLASGVAGAEGTTNLATSTSGTTHVFYWNSFVDLLNAGQTDNFPTVRVRVRVTQTDGLAGPTLATGTFAVWNRYTATVAGGLAAPFPGTIIGPAGLVRAPDGDLIVADAAGHQVVRVDAQTGARTVLAGTGQGGFNGDNQPATTAKLNRPTDVALDPNGHVFVADSGNSRIRRIDAASGFLTTVAGGANAGFAGDGADPVNSLLASAESIDVDASGNLWIADTGNNRIRFVNRSGAAVTFTYWDAPPFSAGTVTQNVAPNTIETVAGPGFLALLDGDQPRQAKLTQPKGLRLVTQLGTPIGYVFCDAGNNRVRAVALQLPADGVAATSIFGTAVLNGTIQTVAGGGSPPAGSVGDGGTAIAASLRDPTACASWLGIALMVADTGQNRIRLVDPTGGIQTIAGTGGFGFAGDGGIPQLANLAAPEGVLVDGSGNLFIGDTGNGRVRMTNFQPWNGVWASSATDIVVAGSTGSILRTNGTTLAVSGVGAPDLLAGIGGSGASDVVAVGLDGVIHRWNGATWTPEASGTTAVLNGVWALTSNNQVAVGQGGTVLRWNGTSWNPETSNTTAWLDDVWAADASNTFAVGSGGTIQLRNSSTWSPMTSNTTADLHGVFGTSASSVWAVGDNGTIRFWNSSTWATQGASVTTAALQDVWAASGTDAWAVGNGGVILRLSGGTWATVTSPTNEDLSAVFGTGSSDVYAVGGADTVLHWNGTSWSQLPTASSVTYAGVAVGAVTIQSLTAPPPGLSAAVGNPKAAVVDAAGNVYVSSTGTHQVLRVDATTRAVTVIAGTGRSGFAGDGGQAGPGAALTAQQLDGIWGPTAGLLFCVGGGGTILRYDGVTWSAMASPVTTDLRAVHGTSATNAFACGIGGVALRWDGIAWRVLATGTTRDLNGVFAAAANDVFFVGANGTLLRWNGSTTTDMTAAMTTRPLKTFRGVWGTSNSDVFAVGDGAFGSAQGPIWHWNGSAWSVSLANNLVNLRGIWGTSSSNAWAVGDIIGLAILYRWNGSGWAGETTNAPFSQRTVFGRSGTDVIAAGVYGGLQTSTGSGTWVAATTSTTVEFRAGIAFLGGPAWLVGEGGTIYLQPATAGAFAIQYGQAMLNDPRGLALQGNVLLIADAGNSRIRGVNLGATAATVWGGGNTVTIAAGSIMTVAGGGSAAGPGFGDGGGATAAALLYPVGLSRDAQTGDVYVADAFHNRVRRIASGGVINAYAGTGTYGFAGDTFAATGAQLAIPFGVSVNRIDASTIEVVIADTLNQRVRRVDNSGIITTVAGSGTAGWNGDNQASTSTDLSYPTDAMVFGGEVWIADAGNSRIRKVTGVSPIVVTVAGTGAAGFNGDVKPGVNTDLSAPEGLAQDATKTAAYIADSVNNRVRRFRP